MRRTHRRPLVAICVAFIASAALAACSSAEPDPSPTSSVSPDPSPTSSVSPASPSTAAPSESGFDYAEPERLGGELARASFTIVGGVTTSSSTTVAPMVAGQTFVVQGECIGGASVDFTLARAAPDAQAETLVEGTIECDLPVEQLFTYELAYDGPVQLSLAVPDPEVTDAWAVARTV